LCTGTGIRPLKNTYTLMKSCLPLYSLLIMVVLYSCTNRDNKQSSEILNKAPFKGLTDSIRRFPNDPVLYLERAVLLSQHNLHELATADYKKLWQMKPEEPVALHYVSNLMLVDKPQEAIALLKECLGKWPDSPDLHRRLTEIYTQSGQTNKAVQEYDDWLQKDSTNFEAWYEKGVLLTKIKDTPAAIQAMERSYQLRPINYNGLALASLYAATLNPKVLTICDELTAKDTSGIINDVLYLKGSYYSDTKQYDKARALFDECIRRDWKFADAYIEKGIIMYDQKKYDSALDVFVIAVTVAQRNPDGYFWMARTYEVLGKKDLALLNYRRALAIDTSFEEAEAGIKRLKK
jgi:tetratricopeptide (TPR) repeat protein